MTEAKTILCDGREQVRLALTGVAEDHLVTLRSHFSRTVPEGDTLTYGEYSNTGTDIAVVDAVSYQVDIRATDPDKLRQIAAAVNTALLALGLRREYSSPDGFDDTHYTKTFRFGRKIDKRTMRLID